MDKEQEKKPELHYAPGAIIGLPYRSKCQCSCHKKEGRNMGMMHMFPCCHPDPKEEDPNDAGLPNSATE